MAIAVIKLGSNEAECRKQADRAEAYAALLAGGGATVDRLDQLVNLAASADDIVYFSDADTMALLRLDTDGTLAANSDTRVASQKAVKTYVGAAVTGLLDFKGSQDASGNPNYPAASKGDAYVVSVAGKIGGASGKSVEIGDMFVASADNAGGTEASVGTSWFVLEHNLAGALLAANNLSDLTNAETSRNNLLPSIPLGPQYMVPMPSATWVDASVNLGTGGQTIQLAADRFDFIPFTPGNDLTIDQMGITVTTGVGGSNIRLGIYSDSAGAPGSLIGETGALSSASNTDVSAAVVTTLKRGTRYWLAILSSSNATVRGMVAASLPSYGKPSLTAMAQYQWRRATYTYGAMPASAPAAAWTAGAGAIVPNISMRVA